MKLSEIKPNPNNPRIIKDDNFKKLVKSIEEFPKMMALRPIVVDEDGMVLGGNMRLKALQHLRFKDIPDEWVKRAADLTEDEQRRFIIADNVSGGEWDVDDLSANWDRQELEDWGLEIEWPVIGHEATEDDYEIPDTIQTDIVLGDLFEIGEHRLLCGDSTDSDSVAKLMNGEKADMVTDPPYGIDINMNMGRRKGKPEKFEKKQWDKSIPDFFYLIPMFEKIIIWGGNYFADKLPISKNWLCWYKKTNGLDFGEFELAYTNANVNTRLISHHWSGETKLHPTMKPVTVMAWCLGYVDSSIIFDPFLGSGSTMVAAHQLNRKCYAMELDPKYCQVIIDRMQKLDPNLVVKRNGEIMHKQTTI
jgi:hypothetical protein